MFILYCYCKDLDYYDVFRIRNSYMLQFDSVTDSYMMVPPTYADMAERD